MNKIIELFKTYKEQILYLVFGAFTTLVNIVVFALCSDIFKFNLFISNFLAWVLSVLFAYITNKIWVFESKTNGFKALMIEITSFVVARLLTLGFDMVIMYLGVELLLWNKLLTKIIANVVVIVSNYIFSKLFIFKNEK